MHTAALVGKNGSIDWLCLPHFDSPSVFGALLDEANGGFFQVRPDTADVSERQFYWPDTNVLVTRFFTEGGAAEVTDFMPVGPARAAPEHHEIIRLVTAVRGEVGLRAVCQPAFDYARAEHKISLVAGGARFEAPGIALGLAANVPLSVKGGAVVARFRLVERQSAVFCLRELDHTHGCGAQLSVDQVDRAFQQTVQYWRRWLAQCRYQGRWREVVRRSALVLKLLTFEPTGAVIAAATTSLPEAIGGSRNWDYRYSWIRDSAFSLYALLKLGFSEEAARYMNFLQEICKRPGPVGPLQLMYGIDGRRTLTEQELPHLAGYRGSRPVRVGNAAYEQLQLDIYGEVIDAIYLFDKHAAPITHDTWNTVRTFVEWVIEHWRQQDEGIWEVRGQRRQFVHSKLMCWVALDRAIRTARRQSLPADVVRWRQARDKVYEDIMKQAWNSERDAFAQSYGSNVLDAAILMMPLMLFVSPVDHTMLRTIDAIMAPPRQGGLLSNNLVFRYNTAEAEDGLSGEEGTFNICTFWLVEALTRAGRYNPERLEQARLIFERMLGFANHLGLYAEQTGSKGEALGNFPQAFTHLALISAALNLDKTLGAGA